MDLNAVLAAVSLLLFLALVGFFGFAVFHDQSGEPREPSGAELIEQHYAPGETVEQPTPYYVAPVPAAPDPLEISSNLDKKILLGAGMLFAIFALVGGYFFTLFIVRADARTDRWRDKVAYQHQLEQSVQPGRNLYPNLCFCCHGKTGLGSTDPSRKDLPGLPLNKPAFKYDNIQGDPVKLKGTQGPLNDENKARKAAGDSEYLLHWIQNAPSIKPGIAMPAFSTSAGGSLSDEQIKAIIEYLQSLK